MGEWPENMCRGRIHNEERVQEVRKGEMADRWGPRGSEGKHTNGRSALTEQAHRTERGSEREHERTDADKPAPPGSGMAYQATRARCAAWLVWIGPNWAEFAFLFSPNFLKAFLFIFSYGIQIKFKFKLIQTCASNKIII